MAGRAGPGEEAGQRRQRAAGTVGLGKGGDQAARDLVELALHGAGDAVAQLHQAGELAAKNWCCRRCRRCSGMPSI